MTAETLRLRGLPASPGLAAGPLVRISSAVAAPRAAGSPQDERAALDRAIGAASAELRALADRQTDSAGEILEFQLALLEDEELRNPAFDDIDKGAPAARAWEGALGKQIESYATAEDDYFRARASDLIDLRDRVLRALAGGDPVVFAAPDGTIVVADDLAPSLFLEIDWGRAACAALMAGSAQSHVAMLARARGVPMVVGLGEIGAPDGETVLLDGERGEIEIAPSSLRVAEWRLRTAALADSRAEENRRVGGPALTRTGKRIRTLVNIHSLADLTPDAALADGVGLVRTEFLFAAGRPLPDEESQYGAYRAILDWAGEKPVTIRTLDAGGDKPIPGVTLDGEANPFLGVRGLRLSLRRPELFKTQLRALARAAAHGALRVMLPMVTTPDELREARARLDEALAELASQEIDARRPPLGVMVETPAAALMVERFDADFYSIGSNDLVQYVTACDRGNGALAALADPLNPAVLELISRVAAHGKRVGAPVSLCGDMAADPRCIPALLACGLEELSVAPSALGRLKAAIAAYG